MLRRRGGRLLTLVPLVALAAACGSTVQMTGQATTAGGGASTQGAGATDLGAAGGTGPLGRLTTSTAPGTTSTASGTTSPLDAGQPTAHGPVTIPPGGMPSGGAGAPGALVTTPITVGVLDTGDNTGFASSFGFAGAAGVTAQQAMRGLVDWYNRHGGIAKRPIKLVEYTASASASSYDTEMSAACASFTQDNHAAVVLTQTGYEVSENYESCLSKAGVPHLQGSIGGYDETMLARHPYLFSLTAASIDRSLTAELHGLTASGFVTSKNKIGVIVEDCPQNTTAYTRTFSPLASELGLQVVRRDIDCIQGYSNMAQAISQVDAAVLPFSTAGVDRVTFVSNYQGPAVVFFEQQAASQGYKPSYALTSYSTAGAYSADLSADAQTRVQGVGWAPDADLTTAGAPSGATKRCRDAFAAEQVKAQSSADALLMDETCGQFFALEDALTATHGHSDAASLRQALESAGTSPLLLGGRRQSAASRHDAATLFAPFGYRSSCSCFAYTGTPHGG